MKRIFFTLILLSIVNVASAYEYNLQFTPRAGARGVTVIGYEFVGDTVLGDCSYYTVGACSGRGCHPPPPTYYYNTCTWDRYGNLLSMTPGAPTAPTSLYTNGTEVVYATSGDSSTGRDTRNFGFVSTPSPHYAWQTLNGGYADIPDAVYLISATLISDGDFPLHFAVSSYQARAAANKIVAQVYGTVTPSPGTATISANTCTAPLAPGATCTVTISYDPTTITCTASPYGFAYTGIDLSLVTNAGADTDFTQRFTVSGVPICND
jgi:hypothetical protein